MPVLYFVADVAFTPVLLPDQREEPENFFVFSDLLQINQEV